MAKRSFISNCTRLEDQDGGATVEFAIVGLLFFTLIFAIIEFGLLMYDQQVITNAGREAARHGIVARPDGHKETSASIEQIARNSAENFLVSFGEKNFRVNSTFSSGGNQCEKFGDELTVSVASDFSFLFLGFSPITLATRATMVCE